MVPPTSRPPKQSRKLVNARNRALGKLWEGELEKQHHLALQARLLIGPIVHSEPHMTNKRRAGGGWNAIYTGATVADYTGMFNGGLTYACECKSTSDERFDREAVPEKQLAHLDAVAAGGGRAFLAMEFRDDDGMTIRARHQYLIPWAVVPWSLRKTHHAITRLDLDAGSWRVTGQIWMRRHVTFCDDCGEVVVEVPWTREGETSVQCRRTCRCSVSYGPRRAT